MHNPIFRDWTSIPIALIHIQDMGVTVLGSVYDNLGTTIITYDPTSAVVGMPKNVICKVNIGSTGFVDVNRGIIVNPHTYSFSLGGTK